VEWACRSRLDVGIDSGIVDMSIIVTAVCKKDGGYVFTDIFVFLEMSGHN